MNNSSPHISFERLADLAEDRLNADEQTTSLAHVSSCELCSEQFERLKRTIVLMRKDVSEDASPRSVAAVLRMFGSQKKTTESALRKIFAALKFDSFALTPAFGLRAEAPSERQMLFNAGEYDLELQIRPTSEGWIISGQVLGPCEGGQIEMRGEATTAQAALNDLCEFSLPQVESGCYDLTFRLRDVELEVTELKLGE
ncbi:MAG TPA: hypothetical protein VID27_03015 [Blastocatellia bacterium]|jgi:hypothetical protein